MGSIPGQRAKIPHAAGQLSPHTAARETRTPQQEKTSHNNKKKPTCTSVKTQCSQKGEKKKKNHDRAKRRNRQLYRYNWGIQHSQQLIELEQKVIQGIKQLNTTIN